MATAYSLPVVEPMTARLVVMMTPADKRALEARARAADLTPSEFVRRASESFDPRVDESLLESFLSEFEAGNLAMAEQLKATNDRVEATIAEMHALRAAHQAR